MRKGQRIVAYFTSMVMQRKFLLTGLCGGERNILFAFLTVVSFCNKLHIGFNYLKLPSQVIRNSSGVRILFERQKDIMAPKTNHA